MSATAVEQVTIPRELAIDLLREALFVAEFHDKLAGITPSPLVADLEELAFRLGDAVYGGPPVNDDGEPSGWWEKLDKDVLGDLSDWASNRFGERKAATA